MTMPIDLVLVRHGHSDGNLVMERARQGDDSLFTPDFRERPGHRWRLTPEGREQASIAGGWIKANIGTEFDRYYASPYVRTQETAGLLGLPDAEWRLDQRLRERDWGEVGSLPKSEQADLYPRSVLIQKNDALYWRPPGGESIADVRLRVRTFFDTLHRECEGQTVIVVTHGEVMSAVRGALEYLSDETWLQFDRDESKKILNTHVYHYSRRDPVTGEIGKYLSWRRAVCPAGLVTDTGWESITRKRFSNAELLERVNAAAAAVEV
jgi:broad specificity phosphatase PhoE